MPSLDEIRDALISIIVTYHGKKTKASEATISTKFQDILKCNPSDKKVELEKLIQEISQKEQGKGYVRTPLLFYILNTINTLQLLINKDCSFEISYIEKIEQNLQFFENMRKLLGKSQEEQIAVKYFKLEAASGNFSLVEENLYAFKNGFVLYSPSLSTSGNIIALFLNATDPHNNLDLLIGRIVRNEKIDYQGKELLAKDAKIAELEKQLIYLSEKIDRLEATIEPPEEKKNFARTGKFPSIPTFIDTQPTPCYAGKNLPNHPPLSALVQMEIFLDYLELFLEIHLKICL